jgi:hypothetical protein
MWHMPCHAVPCEASGGLREPGVTGRAGTCWWAWLRCGSVRVVVVGSGGYSVGKGQGRGRAELHRRLEIGIARQRRIVSGTGGQSRETSTTTTMTSGQSARPASVAEHYRRRRTRPLQLNLAAAGRHRDGQHCLPACRSPGRMEKRIRVRPTVSNTVD